MTGGTNVKPWAAACRSDRQADSVASNVALEVMAAGTEQILSGHS